MATRRTTMRSSTGTKLYAVRDESGKFKDIQTYKRAHAADLRHKSKAEKVAAQGPIEKSIRKAASDAVKSVQGAVAAVQKAAKRAVKQVANPQPKGRKTAKTAVAKTSGKPVARKAIAKTAKKAAPKPVAKRA